MQMWVKTAPVVTKNTDISSSDYLSSLSTTNGQEADLSIRLKFCQGGKTVADRKRGVLEIFN